MKITPNAGPRESGFNLNELMVVITVVSILASLLLPALSNAKLQARKTTCQSNLRQEGVALQSYLGDYNAFPVGPLGEGYGLWQQLLLDYVKSTTNLFYCTEKVQALASYTTLIGATSPNVFPHYGYNDLGAVWTFPNGEPPNLGLGGQFVPGGLQSSFEPLNEAAVIAPADMVAMGDTTGYEKPLAQHADPNNMFFIGMPFSIQDPSEQTSITISLVANWHEGGANMLFVAGNVEYQSQTRWVAPEDAARAQWNNDHQPHPEYWGGK